MARTALESRAAPAEPRPAEHADTRSTLSDPVREYCETLLCRLLWSEHASALPLRMLGITSCHRGEGVSTVASHLAVAAATGGGLPVLLVDANLSRPMIHRIFPVVQSPGWSEVLADPPGVALAIQPSGVKNLSVLPAGRSNQQKWPSDVGAISAVLKGFTADFELAIFDLPAVGQTNAAVRLAGLLDGVLLVVEAERVRHEVAQRTRELLRRANVNLLGAVLNKRRQHVPAWLYRTL